MRGDGRLGGLLALFAALGCAGAVDAPVGMPADPAQPDVTGRFPVRACDAATNAEAVGVWQGEGGSAFVYDGCSVRFSYSFSVPPEMAMFTGMRNIARAFVVDARDYADPMPYFRARAVWHEDWMRSESILGTRDVARWDGHRFWLGDHPYARARSEAELTRRSRALLLADRVVPTEAELAAERGVPMPPPDAPPLDFVQSMMCPTGVCDDERETPEEAP